MPQEPVSVGTPPPSPPPRSDASDWDDAGLDEFRRQGDPLADGLVQGALEQNGSAGIGVLTATIRSEVHHSGLLQLGSEDLITDEKQTLPEPIRKFIHQTSLPNWADPSQIKIAENIFARFGFTATLSLLAAGLPECYTLAKGAQVLHRTQELEKREFLRLFETSIFLIDALGRNALATQGVHKVREVRLFHAAVRHYIEDGPEPGDPSDRVQAMRQYGRWNTEFLGRPINQEDLAYTLLAFSLVTLRTFRTLGIRCTTEEQEAYLFTWNVVGSVLGLDERLMAWTMPEAERLFQGIRERNIDWTGQETDPSNGLRLNQASEDLTARLLEFLKSIRPSWAPRNFGSLLIRILCEKHACDLLRVPPLTLSQRALRAFGLPILRGFNWLRSAVPTESLIARIAEKVFFHVLVDFWDSQARRIRHDEIGTERAPLFALQSKPPVGSNSGGGDPETGRVLLAVSGGSMTEHAVSHRTALSLLLQQAMAGALTPRVPPLQTVSAEDAAPGGASIAKGAAE